MEVQEDILTTCVRQLATQLKPTDFEDLWNNGRVYTDPAKIKSEGLALAQQIILGLSPQNRGLLNEEGAVLGRETVRVLNALLTNRGLTPQNSCDFDIGLASACIIVGAHKLVSPDGEFSVKEWRKLLK